MSLSVLDTDMLILWPRGRETRAARVATTPTQQLFTPGIQLLPFNLPGTRRHRQLRSRHCRTGTNHFRIAAIVLEQQGVW